MHVDGFSDSDPEERAELAWRLQEDLIEADVGSVSRPPAPAPAGAKGPTLEWAQLLVTLVGALPGLVAAVRGWHNRHADASVTLEIDGDRVTLSDGSSREGRELLAAWLQRHVDG